MTFSMVSMLALLFANIKVKNNFFIVLLVITYYLFIGTSLSNFYYIAAITEIGFWICVYLLVMSIKTYDNFIEAWSRNLTINTFMVLFPCFFILLNSDSLWTGRKYADVIYFIGCLPSFALLTIPRNNDQLNSQGTLQPFIGSKLFSLTRNIFLLMTFYIANARTFLILTIMMIMPKSKGFYFFLFATFVIYLFVFGLNAFLDFTGIFNRASLTLDGEIDIPRIYEILTIIDGMPSYSYFLGNGFGSLAQNPFYELLTGASPYYSNFHNSFLEIFFKFGFIGLFVYILFLIQCLRKCQSDFELLMVAGYVVMSFGHSRFSVGAYDLLIHTILILLYFRTNYEINDNNRSLKSKRRYI